jgi:ornithine cyclodeaminase/alanine dehydrogenase
MSAALDVQVEVVTEPRAAVVDADLVVTSGPILKAPTPVIDTDWLAPGAFASPVDFDSYWTGGALRQADKLATDDIAQFEHYREAGYFSDTPAPYADLGQIVAGHQPGREREDERTIAINLGLALEDMATAMPIYERAIELGVGTRLPL